MFSMTRFQTGDGGFSITVAGNTDLKGGLIASDAEPLKNILSTATLTFSDIQNHSEYSAHSGGFSAGATMGDGGGNYSTRGNTSGKSTGGAAPMLSQSDSGSDSATTRSAISAGTISVTDAANQQQDIASLSRDTSGTNGTVARLPDLNNLLDRQADMMAAASAAGEAVSRRIGDFAQSKYDEARAAGDQEGMNAWKEGGRARAEMQMAGAALVTGLAGGNALGGAAGAAIASLAAGKLNDVSSAIAGSHPTASSDMNEALGNIVANAIATSAGGAIAGNAGSVSGYNVDRFNRQLHLQEKTKAQQIADQAKAQKLTNVDGSPITAAQVENAMRAADNSQYGEYASTGVAIPLNADTRNTALYDTTGMKLVTDNTGNYLVQDPSMLTTPSKSMQDLITQNTGGASSPYSWGMSTAQAAAPKIDPYGPFAPAANGCITADCAAGLPASRQTALPSVTFTAGVSGTAVVGYGGSVGVGVYFTRGSPNTAFDAGIYGTYGTGYGFDPSVGAAVGFNKGSASDLRGVASNVNTAVALADIGIGGSVTYNNGQPTGASYGIGIKGVPSVAGGTASVTNMTTCTFGVSNIKSGLAQSLCK